MKRVSPLAVLVCVSAALVLSACGTQRDSVSAASPDYHGSVLFAVRCSGCHSLDKAGTRGSGFNVRDRERTNGPNFNVRKETLSSALYAIRNGGFSGAIMPQNIVAGDDAVAVAHFVADFAGARAPKTTAPAQSPPSTGGAGAAAPQPGGGGRSSTPGGVGNGPPGGPGSATPPSGKPSGSSRNGSGGVGGSGGNGGSGSGGGSAG